MQLINKYTFLKKKTQSKAVVFIKFSLSNLLMQVYYNKNLVFWVNPASCGFKGRQKKTNFALYNCSLAIAETLKERNILYVDVVFKGFSFSRSSVFQAFLNTGVFINKVCDLSSVAFNGCRKPKKKQ